MGRPEKGEPASLDDEVPLFEPPEEIYVDGVLDIEIHEPNVRVTYFQFRQLGDEEVQIPVLVTVRPLGSCHDGVTLLHRRIDERAARLRRKGH